MVSCQDKTEPHLGKQQRRDMEGDKARREGGGGDNVQNDAENGQNNTIEELWSCPWRLVHTYPCPDEDQVLMGTSCQEQGTGGCCTSHLR